MSHEPISRSPDLQRLRDEGFGIAIDGGALIIEPVPFLDANGDVQTGALISDLDMAGQRTAPPSSHVAYFAGGTPCDRQGKRLSRIIISDTPQQKGGRSISHVLSSKPASGRYPDYYEKMRTYADAIASHAESLGSTLMVRCFPPLAAPADSPFVYEDTASSRAGFDTSVFEGLKIAIIGLGGTGVFVLDLVSKTPVASIHLFDADLLLQHNAFRSPGAVTLEHLEERRLKVEHWSQVYSSMHRAIVPHSYRVDEANMSELNDVDFVFMCVDNNESRHLISRHLCDAGIPFTDTGMGLYVGESHGLAGTVRTTTATPKKSDHLEKWLPTGLENEDAAYSSNVQIADLNMLNAALSVIRWKKMLGFYADEEGEHHMCYILGGNAIVNEDGV